MKRYQNYHKHTSWSNISTPDSPVSIEDYVDRIIELGHNVLSSVEHGWQGHYYRVYEAVQNKNAELKKRRDQGERNVPEDLKFIFGTEAYWVKDRFSKEKYGHIILLAKNEEGRREINDILSEANITGYYNKPRVDLELLMSLHKENVFITTACIAFWQIENADDVVKQLKDHFQDSLYLEVQYHNTESQKELNSHILKLSKQLNIPLIMGCDSHYIHTSDSEERDNYLEARGMFYENEEGWYLDYPSYKEAFQRFKEQGVLTDEEIEKAMDNTNIILNFDDITFDKDIKLPSLYPGKSQEWKDKKLKDLINAAWKRDFAPYLSKEQKKIYMEGVKNEYQTITETKMTDYFLLDYEIVKEGKKRGGIISPTARGSGGSFFINTLLGFSNLNRFEAPVKLYPERFMSKTRILETKSLPDLDLNLGTVDIFAQVQKELLGENHAYPMIAFGQLKDSSAFKLYCKSQGVPFEIANNVIKQIKSYEKALNNAEDDEKEFIHLYDYVDEKYEPYIQESKKYKGIINSKSCHPCGYFLYQGDIRREIGLIKCKSESTKKEYITTVVDGYVAETYKFVKNDLLKVDVANTVQKIYDSIGIPKHNIRELTELVKNDKKTWDIYANGYTLGVNQMESNFGVQCCKQYRPKNIAEMTALVSALRPGFKSMLSTFLARKTYTTSIAELDNLLEDSFHYIMYQESIMTYLGWLGVEQTETYAIIKKISKKKFKAPELAELKERLSIAWIEHTGKLDGFEESFQIVEDFSRYAFNASHAYAYAYDSIYGAYLKANYPYHFYSVMLQTYTEKGKKDKVTAYKKEMQEAFGILEGVYKFRLDNRKFSIDEKNHRINPSLSSIKNMGKKLPGELYDLRNNTYNSFIELLKDIKDKTSANKTMIDILIKMDYFSEFGNPNELLSIVDIFELWNNRKTIKKDKLIELGYNIEDFKPYGNETEKQFNKIKSEQIINMLISKLNVKTSIFERLKYEYECLGYCYSKYPKHKDKAIILNIDAKYSPRITIYRLDGEEIVYKVLKRSFNKNPFDEFDMIQIGKIGEKQKQRRIGTDENGKGIYEPIEGSYDDWLYGWKKLNN
ncbi:PHP domain-containing protein [Clostridium sardiniense]|uniref:PHP domain-containing protein n=1 Tax=Clostridium sardiniense TaxID=29369 RepID=UPI001957BA92|nr:PHP domain-containing protein [Clostridium sardiniense]MBM7836482.1 DNA polymerase III alpha subunit [Clostridium sardiniense]